MVLVAGLQGQPFADGAFVARMDVVAVADVERNIRGAVRDRLSGTLPILFSLGRSYALGERIEVGVSVFGLPELALRTSVGWRLP